MSATLMQVLDTTIANVALPHMQAALGATPESVVWILTSYIIFSAIAMPLTGWLEGRIGRRALFTISIGGFTISSMLCGMAVSLETMVIARALQGIFGAFIGPLGQATLLDNSPKEKHAQSMMIWGMGAMIGPIMGPMVGGWLTDNHGWRWVFFINVPIGIVATGAIWMLLDRGKIVQRSFDLMGFALLGLALASLQLMLDRGNHLDWFTSTEILIETGIAVAAFWMFLVHIFTVRSPVLPLSLFQDRNFVLAVVFSMIVTGIMIAGSALLAPMVQTLMGYDAMGAGMLMMPRGLGMFLGMPIAAYFSSRLDPRVLVFSGMCVMAVSLWMMTHFTLDMDRTPILLSGLLQGFGTGLAFLPLNILAFSTLAPHLRTEGAAFYNLLRNVSGAICISVLGAMLSRNAQVVHEELGQSVTATTMPFLTSNWTEKVGIKGEVIAQLIDTEINRQAMMIAYLDDFVVMMWLSLSVLPLVFFMKASRPDPSGAAVHVE